jgi:hypothetical protein
MMKKIIFLIFCVVTSSFTWSQDLYVGSTAAITTLPGSVLFVGSSATVDASASLTTTSDATASGSFIVSGNTTGNITYKRYINNDNWHLVSAPVTSQSIPTFVGDDDNAVANNNLSGGNGNFAVSYYKNTNTAGNRWTYHNTLNPVLENQETLTSFIAGQGYSMKRTATGDYTFTGTMANNDVSVTIPTTSGSSHLWTTIGNPFPSFLPVADILADNPGKLDGSFTAIYVWDATLWRYLYACRNYFTISSRTSFYGKSKD